MKKAIIILAILFGMFGIVQAQEEEAKEEQKQEEQKQEEQKTPAVGIVKPIQVQLVVTGVGSGIHAGYHMNKKVFLGIDSTSKTQSSQEVSSTGGTIKIDIAFSTTILLMRYSPFENPFFFQLGGVVRSWVMDGTSLDSTGAEEYTMKFQWPSAASLIGIGANWVGKSGFSGGLGLSYLIGGNPDITSEDKSSNQQWECALAQQTKKGEEDFKQFANVPYFHLNIGWNF